MLKNKMGQWVGSALLGLAVLGVGVTTHLNTYAATDIRDIKNILVTSGYANTSMIKAKNDQLGLSRREVAEIAVRLYLQIEKKQLEMLPNHDQLTDTNDPYAVAAVNLKLMGPSKGKFNPNGLINRKDFLAIITNAYKGIANGSVSESLPIEGVNQTATQSTQPAQAATGSTNTKAGLDKLNAGKKIIKSYEKVGSDKQVTHKDGWTLLYKLASLVEPEQVSATKAVELTRAVGKFKVPLRQKTDLEAFEAKQEGSNIKLFTLTYNGLENYAKKLTIKDAHMQVIAILRTGKTTLTEDDFATVFNYLEGNYDAFAKAYDFKSTAYIYGGKIQTKLPADPAKVNAIKIDKGITLTLTVVDQTTGKTQ